MNSDFITNIFLILFGLYLFINFRKFGKEAVEQRKKLFGNIISKDKFDTSAIILTQIGFFFMGLLAFIIGIVRILPK